MIGGGFDLVQIAIGGVAVYFGKLAWQRWGEKSNRISEDLCGKNREQCRSKLMAEWYDYKLDVKKDLSLQNSKFQLGNDNFNALGTRLDRTNALLKALLMVEMERCKSSKDVDCDDLTSILVQQGIEVGSLGFRKRKSEP